MAAPDRTDSNYRKAIFAPPVRLRRPIAARLVIRSLHPLTLEGALTLSVRLSADFVGLESNLRFDPVTPAFGGQPR